MIIIKTTTQIEGIRKSSKLAAETLNYLTPFVKPGVTTQYLNDLAHKYIVDHKAIPAPLGYGGFPKSICTSVNEVVCHGIPSEEEVLKDGDIVNLDITTILNGYHGDTSATVPVGNISREAKLLVERTKEALNLSIKALKPNKYLNDCVGKVIEPFVQKFGYSVVRELGGHGVGLKFHEDPFVFHFDIHRNDVILKPGMTFTVEPMINSSREAQVYVDKDNSWTVRTLDRSLSAQFEHTILITPDGYEVLTKI
ncbi:MAG: type I methionyl aminopeptidase [Candidatus Shapirobacteria bacterium]|nr:type I methionyl aminopeptidase [Candidatus Shapirobacteria bacterium]